MGSPASRSGRTTSTPATTRSPPDAPGATSTRCSAARPSSRRCCCTAPAHGRRRRRGRGRHGALRRADRRRRLRLDGARGRPDRAPRSCSASTSSHESAPRRRSCTGSPPSTRRSASPASCSTGPARPGTWARSGRRSRPPACRCSACCPRDARRRGALAPPRSRARPRAREAAAAVAGSPTQVADHVDLDAVLAIARSAPGSTPTPGTRPTSAVRRPTRSPAPRPSWPSQRGPPSPSGMPRPRSCCAPPASSRWTSTRSTDRACPGTAASYIGGGFPEVHAESSAPTPPALGPACGRGGRAAHGRRVRAACSTSASRSTACRWSARSPADRDDGAAPDDRLTHGDRHDRLGARGVGSHGSPDTSSTAPPACPRPTPVAGSRGIRPRGGCSTAWPTASHSTRRARAALRSTRPTCTPTGRDILSWHDDSLPRCTFGPECACGGGHGMTDDLHHHGDQDTAPGLVDLAVNVRLPGPPPWIAEAIVRTVARPRQLSRPARGQPGHRPATRCARGVGAADVGWGRGLHPHRPRRHRGRAVGRAPAVHRAGGGSRQRGTAGASPPARRRRRLRARPCCVCGGGRRRDLRPARRRQPHEPNRGAAPPLRPARVAAAGARARRRRGLHGCRARRERVDRRR